jgi:hypothetical protein
LELHNSSLHELFSELVNRNFHAALSVDDPKLTEYITELLAEFARAENLYKVRDAHGRELQEVGEMLIASNPLLDAPSFEHERQVRKHVGDFTLFFTGMFPESIGKWRVRFARLDSLVDYVKAGKESYQIVAAFDQFEYRNVAPLFRRLSDDFEMFVYGLNLVRRELDLGQPGVAGQIRDLLT